MPKISYRSNAKSIEVERGMRLSDALEENGVPLSLACRSGACGTCIFRVLACGGGWPLPSDEETSTLKLVGASSDERLACQWPVNDDLQIEI